MKPYTIKQWKLTKICESPVLEDPLICDTPAKAYEFWLSHIATMPHFNADVEQFFAVHLNARLRATGFHLISSGTVSECSVHPREVFRTAVVANCSAVILMHN